MERRHTRSARHSRRMALLVLLAVVFLVTLGLTAFSGNGILALLGCAAGIIVTNAAVGGGRALRIGLCARLLARMGVVDPSIGSGTSPNAAARLGVSDPDPV